MHNPLGLVPFDSVDYCACLAKQFGAGRGTQVRMFEPSAATCPGPGCCVICAGLPAAARQGVSSVQDAQGGCEHVTASTEHAAALQPLNIHQLPALLPSDGHLALPLPQPHLQLLPQPHCPSIPALAGHMLPQPLLSTVPTCSSSCRLATAGGSAGAPSCPARV